jgi:hypothetical protein
VCWQLRLESLMLSRNLDATRGNSWRLSRLFTEEWQLSLVVILWWAVLGGISCCSGL